jgi:predicted O-methyltransferase YrrM
LFSEATAPFDFIFIDADKPGYPNYFKWAMKLSRPGTLIVADNVVRKGALLDSNSNDANIQGMRRLLEIIAAERRVSATGMTEKARKKGLTQNRAKRYTGGTLIFKRSFQ